MEKQAYALVKALKYFRDYFWNARIVAYVPHPMVKDILLHQECSGTRGRWITKIQEYDLELKPTKLVCGQGLAKLMAESSLVTVEKAAIEDPQSVGHISAILSSLEQHGWYSTIVYYLKNLLCAADLKKTQK
jgi:hypothetical protein